MSKMGRPTLRTPEVVQTILDGLSNGQTLTSLCEGDGMPTPSTFRAWAREDTQLSSDFARAREAGFDAIAEDALRISNTPLMGVIQKRELLGVMKRKDQDGQDVLVVMPDAEMVVTEERVEDMIAHRKLQIETRLKLLAKWDPRRYGEKVEVKGTMTLEQLVTAAAAPRDEPADE